jgi:hypothetical protein
LPDDNVLQPRGNGGLYIPARSLRTLGNSLARKLYMIPPDFFHDCRASEPPSSAALERRRQPIDLPQLQIVYQQPSTLRKTMVLLLWVGALSAATACGWLVWSDVVSR